MEKNNTKVEKVAKKKKSLIVRFFLSIITVIITILMLLAAAFAFAAFDRRSSLASIPRNYSIYLRTDSAFDTVNPLFDLQAADVFLSAPEFSSVRKTFMDFRSSELRENPFFRFALSRPVDFAIYSDSYRHDNSHFVAVVNLGMFSLFTRLASYMYPKLDLTVENLTYKNSEQASYYVYKIPESKDQNGRITQKSQDLYIKSVKNLVIVSDSFEHLITAALAENDATYTPEQKKLFKGSKKGELRIVADAHSLMRVLTEGNQLLSSMADIIASDSLSVISFSISDSSISVKSRIPVSPSSEDSKSLSILLSKKSTAPVLLTRLSDITQYYTILNAGTFQELKDSVLPFVPEIKNPDEFWKNSDDWCKTILNMDLNEFLFSWTGSEFAVLGIENQNDPVFVIQVKDEKQRQSVFNRLTSSILVKDDNSLILGGVRLPQLKFPPFLNWILSLMGVNMPAPYFMVLDGNIYFSESPECLSAVYTNAHSGKALVKSENYQAVSGNQKIESSLSLFYNLERSIPFFLRSKEVFSRVLQLYTMGRFDVRIDKNLLELSLDACARKSGSLYSVPGFPISLEGKASPENLQADYGKSPNHVYWVEDGGRIKALELSGMTAIAKSENDSIQIVSAKKNKYGGAVWAVSSHGMVNLLTPALENTPNFPLMLGDNVQGRICAAGDNLVVITERGSVSIIKADASVSTVELPGLSVKSAPGVLDGSDFFVIYSKGFLGKIYCFDGDKCLNADSPIMIPGIGLGSPAIMKNGNKKLIAFVTQAGELNVWRSDSTGEQIEGFPKKLGGVFMTNVVASDKYFYALSNDAILYRISKDGSLLTVQIPNSTAKSPYLCVRDSEHNGKFSVFVCADANVIYGFNENLELLSGYPLSGCGYPVFADANGDKIGECIALTVDKKLVAWKVR